MGSHSQTLQQARKPIGQLDFDGAIEVLSPIDDPTADELFALAEAYFLKAASTNHFSDLQRTHPPSADLLAQTALLALVQADDWEAYLDWAEDENHSAPWAMVANGIMGMDSRKERVAQAKELLSGQTEAASRSDCSGNPPALIPAHPVAKFVQ